VKAKSDQQEVQWTRRRRPVPPVPLAARTLEGPRFDRFAAAMEEARVVGAPETLLYCDSEPGVRRAAAARVARYPAAGPSRRWPLPSFVGRSLPGRAILQWVGIAGCILVFSVLVAHWAIRTNVAETAQLFGAHVGEALRVPTEPVERQAGRLPPAPDARADDLSPPPQNTPPTAGALLAQATALQSSAEHHPATTTASAASGPHHPRAGFPPLPRFKPTVAGD
jgi:hypothetical protein